MKGIFETAVSQPRFSMAQVYRDVREQDGSQNVVVYQVLENVLGKSAGKKVIQGLLRFAFFIEPVKTPKIESTKYAVRWGSELASPDPRHASYSECRQIYRSLLAEVEIALQDDKKAQLLRAFAQQRLLAYELPLDYKQRSLNGPIHRSKNINFIWDVLPHRIVGLRQRLLTGQLADIFKLAYSKIVVKSYLTDRVLTGEYKTNREKRWETHPASVHFALRRDCWEIELVLINQLCYFAGFPSSVQQNLEAQGLIDHPRQQEGLERVSRCPITLEPLSFVAFKEEVLTPKHGKAAFQIGHMHPLKATADNPFSGHTGKNVSWISAQGNRIQGEYSVAETRELILRIIRNYKAAGLVK